MLLVTGATGMIGRRLVAIAAQESIDVTASARRRPGDLAEGVCFVPCDLDRPDAAAELVRQVRPSILIQTAWLTTQPTYWSDPANIRWVETSIAMAKAFAEVGGERFIQVGSCAEYDWSFGRCVEGETPDQPATRYGKAKLAAFHAIATVAQDRFEAVDARIFFVYGPGESAARLIPLICRSHLAGHTPELGSGSQWRELLYVDDAARALLALSTAPSVDGIVNIAASEPVLLADVARMLARLANAPDDGLGRREDRPNDPSELLASSDRLRATGWLPRVDLETGLDKTLCWWRNQAEMETIP